MSLVYVPSDDSFLLEDVLRKEVLNFSNEKTKFLEIGIGSGIQLQALLEIGIKKENIFGVDINFDAVLYCKKQGFNVWYSDLFSDVKGKFDCIIFNPPYLPEDEDEDDESKLITTGGVKGSEVINEFLVKAKKHLKKSGRIYLLVSSLSKGIDYLDYKKKLIQEKKLFFENLEVWELRI